MGACATKPMEVDELIKAPLAPPEEASVATKAEGAVEEKKVVEGEEEAEAFSSSGQKLQESGSHRSLEALLREVEANGEEQPKMEPEETKPESFEKMKVDETKESTGDVRQVQTTASEKENTELPVCADVKAE